MVQKLREFASGDGVNALVMALQASFGRLYRVGGPERVYQIDGEGLRGAIYTTISGNAIGIGWRTKGQPAVVFYWVMFDPDIEPDYAVDLPVGEDFVRMAPTIAKMIKAHKMGAVAV